MPIRKSKRFAVCAPPRISTSLKSESPSAAVALGARWASPQTSSQEPIQQRSTSEKFSRGSSSTIVAFSASSSAVRRRNHSAQCAPSNPMISTWENSRMPPAACCKRLRSVSPGSTKPHFFSSSLKHRTTGANDDSPSSWNFQPAVSRRSNARSSSAGARATALAARASDSSGRSSISLAAIARSKRRCSGSAAGVASSRASNVRKLDGVTNCKPRCEEPFAIKRALRSLACPRVGTTTSEGNARFHAPGKTRSNQGAIASSHACRSDGTTNRTGRDRFIAQFSFAATLREHALVAEAARHTLTIQLFEKWDHSPARALECLPQLAHSRWSVFGNEIDDRGLHLLEVFSQQNNIGIG